MLKQLLLVSVAAAIGCVAKTAPFLKEINSTHWVIGNDLWNVTQGPIYATNLQYQGSDAVRTAAGHYAGYGERKKPQPRIMKMNID